MPPAGFKPTVPKGDCPQNHDLDRAAAGIGKLIHNCLICRLAYYYYYYYYLKSLMIIIIVIIITLFRGQKY